MGDFLMEVLYRVPWVLLGFLIHKLFSMMRTTFGTLRIDHSNPETDIYRIELDDLDIPRGKTRVVLDVDHNADLSQE